MTHSSGVMHVMACQLPAAVSLVHHLCHFGKSSRMAEESCNKGPHGAEKAQLAPQKGFGLICCQAHLWGCTEGSWLRIAEQEALPPHWHSPPFKGHRAQ